MNTAAILLGHELQSAEWPSDKAENQVLGRMLSHIHRLRELFAVTIARDRGLTPGDAPPVTQGILRLLGPQMHARLRNDRPIAGWRWHVPRAPDHDGSARRATDDDLAADDHDDAFHLVRALDDLR